MKRLRGIVRAVSRFVAWMFDDLNQIFFERKPVLPEDTIPVNKRGEPDLSFYTEPVQHYIDLYASFLNSRWKGLTREQQSLAWKQRVHATWGLFAKGQEALPFLLTLIRHPNPDAREDGSFLLGRLKLEPGISEQLLVSLQNEKDLVVKSAIVESLGKLRYRPAIPALASLILNKEIDLDTRSNAADALGSIVGQDFSGPDKLQKAEAWLGSEGSDVNW